MTTQIRPLPQDLEAEQACIGAMLLHRDAVGWALTEVESSDFIDARHRILFDVAVELWKDQQPIDLVMVKRALHKSKQLDEVGGTDYLVQLAESVPSYLSVVSYAKIVREMSQRRNMITAALQLSTLPYDLTTEWTEIVNTAERSMMRLGETSRTGNKPSSMGEVLEEVFAKIEAGQAGVTGVPSGFYQLDDLLAGFHPGELILIGARPSMGKTASGISIAADIAIRQKKPVAFYSMEMPKQDIVSRFLCHHAKVDGNKIRRGMVSSADVERLKESATVMQDSPLLIDDTMYMSTMDLRSRLRLLHQKHHLSCAIVDYLQLMRGERAESRQVQVSAISRELKALARELEIPLIVLAQLNRLVEGRTDHRPRMSDLRESGSLEQDADVIILLHREWYYLKPDEKTDPKFADLQNRAEFIVDKQRNGPTGTVELAFFPEFSRFDNLAAVHQEATDAAAVQAARREAQDLWTETPDPIPSDEEPVETDNPF